MNQVALGEVTALMAATFTGHDNFISLLVEKGADVNAVQSGGATALMLAVSAMNNQQLY